MPQVEPVKLHVYVRENVDVIRRLIRAGYLSGRIMNSFRIWSIYKANAHIRGKMDRYQHVANEYGCSERTVMRAIDEMEKRI